MQPFFVTFIIRMDKNKITKNALDQYEAMPEHKALQALSKVDAEILANFLDSALDYNTKYPNVFKYISTIVNTRDKNL